VSGPPIRAVGVVIPARDEEHHIGRCLRSVRRALRNLPACVDTSVAVVLDRCRDRTPQRVTALLRTWPQASAMRVTAVEGVRVAKALGADTGSTTAHIVRGSGVGALRHVGALHALRPLRLHPLSATWLLTTDADTTVPPDWALAHLRYAAGGAMGVAGVAELADPTELPPDVRGRYQDLLVEGIDGVRHSHVYGANLGVRADAYVAAGGFPGNGSGEDHALWDSLRKAGFRLVQPTAVRVRTSARTRGRASGGLADLLRTLHAESPIPMSPTLSPTLSPTPMSAPPG